MCIVCLERDILMIKIVLANLIVKKLGDIVIESRDHAVPLFIPVEILTKGFILNLNQQVHGHNEYGLGNHVKCHPYVDSESGELRIQPPLCKVNIMEKNKRDQGFEA